MGQKKENGQILLIVVLVIITASTIGLSLASRTITSMRTSTEEAESQKALAAAEAGIERAVQSNLTQTGVKILGENPSNNSKYSTDVVQVKSSKFLINGGNLIPKNDGADVWLAEHDNNGDPDLKTVRSPESVSLYWGLSSEQCGSSNAPAAIQAIIVTRDEEKTASRRFVYDPCVDRENNFTKPQSEENNVGGQTFRYVASLVNKDIENKDIENIVFIRIIPIYKDTVAAVDMCNPAGNNCSTAAPQGYVVTSTGTSGDASRRIAVFKGYPQAYLPYLSYGLFVAN